MGSIPTASTILPRLPPRDGHPSSPAACLGRWFEAWLLGLHISPYAQGNRANHDPLRPRKLLLHRGELNRLLGKIMEKGLTLIPLRLYFKQGRAKVELGLARGRKTLDKRQAIRDREERRDMSRALRERSR